MICISKRKSWFWHWFVSTSWKSYNHMKAYHVAMLGKWIYPFRELEHPTGECSNRYEVALLFRRRAIRDKNCNVYQY
jgi:hypothetical protein